MLLKGCYKIAVINKSDLDLVLVPFPNPQKSHVNLGKL